MYLFFQVTKIELNWISQMFLNFGFIFSDTSLYIGIKEKY